MNSQVGKVKGEAQVIFFDAAGTLIRLERPAGWHYAKIAQKHGLQGDPKSFEAAFREIWGTRSLRAASDKAREADDRPWWRALALDVLHKTLRT
ncbi:MAG TPA: hypothetical protein VIT23_06140, partial [Terrimicrobiaceae bacterium]